MPSHKKGSGMHLLLNRKNMKRPKENSDKGNNENVVKTENSNNLGNLRGSLSDSVNSREEAVKTRSSQKNSSAKVLKPEADSESVTETLVLQGHDSASQTPTKRSARLATSTPLSAEKAKGKADFSELKQSSDTRANENSNTTPKKGKLSTQNSITGDSSAPASKKSSTSKIGPPEATAVTVNSKGSSKGLSCAKYSDVGSGSLAETLVLKGHDSPMKTPVKRSARLLIATPTSESVEKTKRETDGSNLKQSSDILTDEDSIKSLKKGKLSTKDLISKDSSVHSLSTKSKLNAPEASNVTTTTLRSKPKEKYISSLDTSDSDADDFLPARNNSVKKLNPKVKESNTSDTVVACSPKKATSADIGSPRGLQEQEYDEKSHSFEVQRSPSVFKKIVSKTRARNLEKDVGKNENSKHKEEDNTSRKAVDRPRTPSPKFHLSP